MNEINYHLSNEKMWGDNEALFLLPTKVNVLKKKYITDACTVKPVKYDTCVICFPVLSYYNFYAFLAFFYYVFYTV